MYNLPENIRLFDNSPMSPCQEEKEYSCPTCGSTMFVSSFDDTMLECVNDSCDTKVSLTQEY